MQESWGAEILDNAKPFNTAFSLYSVCTAATYRLDAASCGKGNQMLRSFLHAEVRVSLGMRVCDPLSDLAMAEDKLAP